MSKPVKIGPWGGDGGEPRDIEYTPLALVRVAIRSGDAINAIGFTYVDTSGNLHEEEWGGSEGEKFEELLLQELEYVLEISGTYGSSPESYVTSLELVTNKGRTIRGGTAGSGVLSVVVNLVLFPSFLRLYVFLLCVSVIDT
ncbi:horcolin-like [Triticum dicoccoides]|uniref:horcolin-like n=1 Tax=Triticum dicoccoides TaxID=85692 RepID=UPI00188FB35F|nr:horcolin-like [Triticum dicoccoides]